MSDWCFFDDVKEAIESGDRDRVRKLLQLDVEWEDAIYRRIHRALTVDARDEFGWTYLMHAASRGDLDMVKLLVEAGADPNALPEDVAYDIDRANYGWTAKRIASARGHRAVVDYLAPLTRLRGRGRGSSGTPQDDRPTPSSDKRTFDGFGVP